MKQLDNVYDRKTQEYLMSTAKQRHEAFVSRVSKDPQVLEVLAKIPKQQG